MIGKDEKDHWNGQWPHNCARDLASVCCGRSVSFMRLLLIVHVRARWCVSSVCLCVWVRQPATRKESMIFPQCRTVTLSNTVASLVEQSFDYCFWSRCDWFESCKQSDTAWTSSIESCKQNMRHSCKRCQAVWLLLSTITLWWVCFILACFQMRLKDGSARSRIAFKRSSKMVLNDSDLLSKAFHG